MRNRNRVPQALAFAAAFAIAASALAGPFDDWAYRSRIGLSNAAGASHLMDFPLLVPLHAGNFDFGQAKPDGADIRFADSDGALLSYEIETWDPGNSRAALWVKVPQIDAASTADYIELYHGNTAATDAQNPADVWSNGYKGVWHLDGSGTALDSTGRHDGTVTGAGVTSSPGIIGDARAFDASNARITARTEDLGPGVSSLDAGDGISVSYWMQGSTSQPGGYTRALSKNIDGVSGWEYQRGGADAHQNVRIDTDGGNNQVRRTADNAFDDAWHFHGLTLDTGQVRGLLDGGSPAVNGYNHGGGFANDLPLNIGARANGGNQFAGLLDEVRFSDVVRSDDWMNAEYRSQAGLMAQVGVSHLVGGLQAEYTHEQANPLTDTSGNGNDATNGGGVSFAAPTAPGTFQLGSVAGDYPRSGSGYLDVPNTIHVPGDDFTFLGMVRKNSDESGGHQTILSTNRFRYQFRNTGGTDGAGTLRLDVNDAGASGPGESGDGTWLTEEWYFTALTYDAASQQLRAYLQDGSPVFLSAAFTRTANGAGLNDLTSFRLGGDGLSGIGGFDTFGGQIDETRFYDRALSQAELRSVFRVYAGLPSGPFGKVAQYSHESGNPLADDTGHGLDATNGGGVSFVAPASPSGYDVGAVVGDYPRASNGYLNVPGLHTTGDDFTFVALVRKDADETGGHQTVLGTDRFRFQFQNTGATDDGAGQLRLDVNSPGLPGASTSGTGTFGTEEWYFVAMTYDASTQQISAYLQPDSPVFLSTSFAPTANGADGIGDMSRFRIGGDGLSGIGGFDAFGGQIDGVRFYDQTFDKRGLREIFRELRGMPAGPVGLVAEYTHEGASPLADDTGHRMDLTSLGGVAFVAPPPGNSFPVGSVAGEYQRAGDDALELPSLHTAGDDFTFVALVRKDADESGGHQTILSTDRFRFQFQNTGSTTDGGGRLRLDINGAGATGSADGPTNLFQTEDWYFVALTYDATTKEITGYLQPDSAVFMAPMIGRTAGGADGLDDMTRFRIGLDGLSGIGGGDGFGGHIDDIRIYDRAFSRAELASLFSGYRPVLSGPIGLVAAYGHEGPNPMADDTGHDVPAYDGGGIQFVAPPDPGLFRPGNVVGHYPRSSDAFFDVPNFRQPDDDFTFVALVRKNADESGGHQTILGTNRFRFQFRDTDGTDGAGTLRLDVNGAGASGGNESGDGTFLTEEWYFVAFRYDSATHVMEAFLQDDSSAALLPPVITRTANGALGIDDMSIFRVGADGVSGIGSTDAFGGWIDSVGFYDAYLTDAELQALFRDVWVPEPATLVVLAGGLLALARRRRRA